MFHIRFGRVLFVEQPRFIDIMNGSYSLNGDSDDLASIPPLQLSFTLPSSPDTRVQLQLTNMPKTLVLYISTSTVGAPSAGASLGNLVYALPNVS